MEQITLLQEQILHHPVRQVAHALLSNELLHPRMGLRVPGGVGDGKQHGVGNIQACQMVEGGLRKDHLVPLLEVVPALKRDRESLVLMIETLWHTREEAPA